MTEQSEKKTTRVETLTHLTCTSTRMLPFFFEIKNGVVSVHFKCLKFKNLFDKATKKIFPWLSLHAYKCASVCVCFMAGQIVNGQKIHRTQWEKIGNRSGASVLFVANGYGTHHPFQFAIHTAIACYLWTDRMRFHFICQLSARHKRNNSQIIISDRNKCVL